MKEIDKVKICGREGCNNPITGSSLKRHCDDPECIAARRSAYYSIRKEKESALKQNATINPFNIIIKRNKNNIGKLVTLHCCANGINGRCKNKFNITINPGQVVYPKCCEAHRNSFRKHRFENVKGVIC